MQDSKENSPNCPFSPICGAGVIRQYRGENWRQRYCYSDFNECVHFQFRIGLPKYQEYLKKK